MLQHRVRQLVAHPSDESCGENCTHHVAVRDLAERMAGEQSECGGRRLLRDPHGCRFDDAVTGDFVFECLALDDEGDDVATFQFVDIHERCIGGCAMSTEDNVALLACRRCSGPLSDAFVEDRISDAEEDGRTQFQF